MKGTLMLTVGLVAMIALVGCGANNPAGPGAQAEGLPAAKEAAEINDLIGTWQMQGGVSPPAAITFKGGGQVEVNEETGYGATVTTLGTYQVEGNKLVLRAGEEAEAETREAPYVLKRFTTYFYSIEGNANGKTQLTLANADGMTRWVKV